MRAMSHTGCALPSAGLGSGMLAAGGLPRWMLSAIGLVAEGSRKAGFPPSCPSACMGGGRTAFAGPALLDVCEEVCTSRRMRYTASHVHRGMRTLRCVCVVDLASLGRSSPLCGAIFAAARLWVGVQQALCPGSHAGSSCAEELTEQCPSPGCVPCPKVAVL